LSAGQLANQVRLRAREAIARYYDGALVSDDELAPGPTRDICLRMQARVHGCPASQPGNEVSVKVSSTHAQAQSTLTDEIGFSSGAVGL